MSAVLSASLREGIGVKGTVRGLRREGFIPAVVYGGAQDPQAVYVSTKSFDKEMDKKSFRSHIYTLEMDKGASQKVLIRDIAFHPVKDTVSHVDFLRVTEGTRITLTVPLEFTDEATCPGLKRGGILNAVFHHLEVSVPADAIPERFICSLKGKNLGEAVHLSDLDIPPSVRVLKLKPETTIANINAPSGGAGDSSEEDAEKGA
jgi:large subunit ribosomal protein L25